MIDLLLAILLAFAHPSNYPHVAVYVQGDHVRCTMQIAPGRVRTWMIERPHTGFMVLWTCDQALLVGTPMVGDLDGDNDVDLADLAIMLPMWTGPGGDDG